jgi:hypothetical protein
MEIEFKSPHSHHILLIHHTHYSFVFVCLPCRHIRHHSPARLSFSGPVHTSLVLIRSPPSLSLSLSLLPRPGSVAVFLVTLNWPPLSAIHSALHLVRPDSYLFVFTNLPCTFIINNDLFFLSPVGDSWPSFISRRSIRHFVFPVAQPLDSSASTIFSFSSRFLLFFLPVLQPSLPPSHHLTWTSTGFDLSAGFHSDNIFFFQARLKQVTWRILEACFSHLEQCTRRLSPVWLVPVNPGDALCPTFLLPRPRLLR